MIKNLLKRSQCATYTVCLSQKALKLDPGNVTALDALGKYAIAKQLPEKAMEYYRIAADAE